MKNKKLNLSKLAVYLSIVIVLSVIIFIVSKSNFSLGVYGREESKDYIENIPSQAITYYNLCHKYEQKILLTALTRQNWNQTKAAEYLGIHRNTLIKKMKKFNFKKV